MDIDRDNDFLDYNKSIFYKIAKLAVYIESLGKDFFESRNLNVTVDEFAALNAILRNPGICQRDLAKIILRDRVRTGRILSSLEMKEYITRTNDTKNNRLVKKIEITQKGKDLYETHREMLLDVSKEFLKHFSQEQKNELSNYLDSLENTLSKLSTLKI